MKTLIIALLTLTSTSAFASLLVSQAYADNRYLCRTVDNRVSFSFSAQPGSLRDAYDIKLAILGAKKKVFSGECSGREVVSSNYWTEFSVTGCDLRLKNALGIGISDGFYQFSVAHNSDGTVEGAMDLYSKKYDLELRDPPLECKVATQ